MRPEMTPPTWCRRAFALAGAASVLTGVVLLPFAGAVGAAQAATKHGAATPAPAASTSSTSPSPSPSTSSPSPSPSTTSPSPKPSKTPKPGPHQRPPTPAGGIVVKGPKLWDPAANKNFADPSYVTVSQDHNLTNQVVEVSWRNVTPSSSTLYSQNTTNYPVMVAECHGTDPTRWSQCFGADNGGVAGSFSAYGPMNTAYATTTNSDTGQTPIQLLTAEEDNQLGCNIGKPCSLVIVPAQGGNIFGSKVNCSDHSEDAGLTAVGAYAFNSFSGECSWRDRIIVPLYFSRTPTDCPVRAPAFSVIGSPMAERAMVQWQSGLCSGTDPLAIQYDSAQAEPLAREDFLAGTDDVALTTVPSYAKGKYPYTYAPIAVSAEVITYWIDKASNGQPITHLKLDQRLVLKLLTQSYDFDHESCGLGKHPVKGIGCDNAVDGDPLDLFADPEFIKLNGHIAPVGDGYQVPTVLGGESDMTWELTRWIAANKPAKAFADGSFDPWGEHVNTDYLDMALPTNSLNSMDPYPPIAHRYTPVYPLSQVAQYQVDNWYPATDWTKDPEGNYDKLDPETTGDRALFAIMDEADAAAFQLPVAAIRNAAGKYVLPTDANMSAALTDMQTSRNKITQSLSMTAKTKNAYPLTMVIYAMVPTGGISKHKAAKIAQWLDYIAGPGQHSGAQSGQLPVGYLPLTAKMRAQTLKAAQEVLDQTGNSPHKKSSPSPSTSPTATPATGSSSSHKVGLSSASNPIVSGLTRYALPVLLIVGGLLIIAGSSALAVGRGSAAAVSRLRRLSPAGLVHVLRRKKQ